MGSMAGRGALYCHAPWKRTDVERCSRIRRGDPRRMPPFAPCTPPGHRSRSLRVQVPLMRCRRETCLRLSGCISMLRESLTVAEVDSCNAFEVQRESFCVVV